MKQVRNTSGGDKPTRFPVRAQTAHCKLSPHGIKDPAGAEPTKLCQPSRVGMLDLLLVRHANCPFIAQKKPYYGLAYDRLTRVQRLLAGNPAPLQSSTTENNSTLD